MEKEVFVGVIGGQKSIVELIIANLFSRNKVVVFFETHCAVPILLLSRHIMLAFHIFCPNSPCIETLLACFSRFLSRFPLYRDTSYLLLPVSVPIPHVSRHILLASHVFCPDSPYIETHLACFSRFLSRFLMYRDTSCLFSNSFCPDSPSIETHYACFSHFLSRFSFYRDISCLFLPVSVPIPHVSRHFMLASHVFCPDSPCIETLHTCFNQVLSCFSLYRDTSYLLLPVSVPIPHVSRHFLLASTSFCPDSPCIETLHTCFHQFLSRFSFYRDTSCLPLTFSVPIPHVSRHFLLASTSFCPDSPSIETLLACFYQFLSRFSSYRDTSCLPLTFSVPILLLSRHIMLVSTSFCPDSPSIETHYACFYQFLSRFPMYRDTSCLLQPVSLPILLL